MSGSPNLLRLLFDVMNGKVRTAEDLVGQFDFSKISVKDEKKQDFLHCALAPSFGKLNSETIKALDDEMKIMIAGLTKDLASIKAEDRTWEAIVDRCAKNPLLQAKDDGIYKVDSLIKHDSRDFKTDGSPDSSIVREVETWFQKLIADEDVIKSTMIDINTLGRIVAQSGATIDSFETFFAKSEKHQKTMLDIGVLRYPDIDNPYFKIYRIKLTAWSDSTRVLFHQDDNNGIEGVYNMRRYEPRSSIISGLSQRAKDSALEAAENLLTF